MFQCRETLKTTKKSQEVPYEKFNFDAQLKKTRVEI